MKLTFMLFENISSKKSHILIYKHYLNTMSLQYLKIKIKVAFLTSLNPIHKILINMQI